MNVELMKHIVHMGAESGRVGSGQTFCRQSRVGSGQGFAGSGRVQEKWPVDNSVATGKAPGPSLEQGSEAQFLILGPPERHPMGPRDMAQNGT